MFLKPLMWKGDAGVLSRMAGVVILFQDFR